MRLEARIERLESAMVSGSAAAQYDNRVDYNGHLSYAADKDGSVIAIDSDLRRWPDERSLWATRPSGTKFLRISGGETAEIIDGTVRVLHFRPVEISPDGRLGIEEALRDLGVDMSQGVER